MSVIHDLAMTIGPDGSQLGIGSDNYDFSEVSVVLYNSTQGMRRTMRDAFDNLRIRKIADCRDIDVTREAVVEIEPDIVFLDHQKDQDQVCALINDIRHNNVGANPFMVIILVTWDTDELTIAAAMQAGADDIVSMPVSINVLKARIENMILNRKKFIVTQQYVGPERRKHERARALSSDNDIAPIVVPNNLRFKVAGDAAAAAHADVIANANKLVNQHMLHRMITELCKQAVDLESEIKKRNEYHGAFDITYQALVHMSDLLGAISEHIDTKGYDNLKALAVSMNRVMAMILETPEPTANMFEILKLHGQAISSALWDKNGTADMVVQALQTVVEVKA